MFQNNQLPRFKTACWTCRGRKVKCDKALPCRNCVGAGIVCSYPSQVRTVQRPKRARDASGVKEDESLLQRFDRLESLLKKHAPHLRLDGTSDGFNTDSEEDGRQKRQSSINSSSGQRKRARDLDPPLKDSSSAHQFAESGKGRWNVSSDVLQAQQHKESESECNDVDYWNRLESECASQVFIKSPSTTKSGNSGKEANLGAQPNVTPGPEAPDMSFPFPQLVTTTPPPLLSIAQRQVCWRRYVENVDPLLKILHKPTMEGMMLVPDVYQLGTNYSAAALIQAVCLLAVISMSEEDVLTNLENTKETLMRSCVSLTEQTLMAANFLDAQHLGTIQALLLYLYYLKYKEDSRIHSLCNVAIYLAARMRLNRDGASLGLPQLQVELRRRLWWQLIILVDHPDVSSFECFPHSAGADTRLPLNVNDSELKLHEAYITEEGGGFTELSFCLMQYEITRTFNQIKVDQARTTETSKVPIEGAEQRLHSTRDVLESRFFQDRIRDCPIGKFAADVVAMIVAKRRILMYVTPDRDNQTTLLPQAAHDKLFLLGIHVLELSRGLRTVKNFEKWRWLSTTYFQWAVATFVVKGLAIRPRSPATQRAWLVVDGILDHWPEATRMSEKANTLKVLMGHAIRNRETETIWNLNPNSSSVPESSNQYMFSSEAARYKMADKGKKNETNSGWAADHGILSQQQMYFSPLSQAMELDKYGISDLNFDDNAFGFDFR